MLIEFPNIAKKCKFKDVVTSLSGNSNSRDNMFYLFNERKGNVDLKPVELAESLQEIMKKIEGNISNEINDTDTLL